MGKDGASRALIIIAAVLAAILLIGVFTFAGPCVHDDGSLSMCAQSRTGIAVAALLAGVLAVAALFVKNGKLAGVLLVVAALAGAFAAIAPGNILPLCMMSTMHCRAVMLPFAEFMGAALAAIALIAGIRCFRQKG